MAVAYLRVSTEEQSSNFSLEAQIKAINICAKSKNLKIEEVIRDIGSGSSDKKRPGIRALRARDPDTIIISAISRLGQNTLISLELFEKHKIISASEGEFIGPSGKLFFTLLSAIAEFELDLIHSRASQSIKIKSDNYFAYISKYLDIFAQTLTLREICTEFEKLRIKTPRGNFKWNAMQIKRLKDKYLL